MNSLYPFDQLPQQPESPVDVESHSYRRSHSLGCVYHSSCCSRGQITFEMSLFKKFVPPVVIGRSVNNSSMVRSLHPIILSAIHLEIHFTPNPTYLITTHFGALTAPLQPVRSEPDLPYFPEDPRGSTTTKRMSPCAPVCSAYPARFLLQARLFDSLFLTRLLHMRTVSRVVML